MCIDIDPFFKRFITRRFYILCAGYLRFMANICYIYLKKLSIYERGVILNEFIDFIIVTFCPDLILQFLACLFFETPDAMKQE